MNRVPFITNYRNFGISHSKLMGNNYWLGDYRIQKEVQEKIKIKIGKDKKIELNLNKYIPNESFQDMNFMDWIMNIYDMKFNKAISISIAPNGNIIIT